MKIFVSFHLHSTSMTTAEKVGLELKGPDPIPHIRCLEFIWTSKDNLYSILLRVPKYQVMCLFLFQAIISILKLCHKKKKRRRNGPIHHSYENFRGLKQVGIKSVPLCPWLLAVPQPKDTELVRELSSILNPFALSNSVVL